MYRKDFEEMSKTDRLLVDAQIQTMMSTLQQEALKGLYATLCTIEAERIIINKRYKGLLIQEIYLFRGKVVAHYEVDRVISAVPLEDLDPWIVVRLAIKVYNAWQSLVAGGILDIKQKKGGNK